MEGPVGGPSEAASPDIDAEYPGASLLRLAVFLWFALFTDKDGLEVYVHRDRISLKRATVLRRKTIVFIRHGESIWNLCFNRGVLTPEFPLRLFLLVLCELLLLWEFDSVLLDSPLSSLGIEQALSIRQHQQQDAESARVAALANALPDVQQQRVLLLTSNLRRASSTLLLAAGSVLACGKCSARVSSCLHETTRNPDGFPLAPALRVPSLSRLEIALMGCGGPMGGFPRASGAPPPRTAPTLAAGGAAVSSAAASGVGCVDPGGNRGPPSSSSRLWKRLLQFAEEAMGVQEETVIAPEADLPASRRKLSNCGVLSLRLAQIQVTFSST
ncbi:histidine phosphatase clade-1 [Cyclospora cayetanensis]|uniref:Histidine phosphatase clade-1 n=1 Tax=Cyclospora cayetanensis TaxID=88456 RepID=A0A1D3CXW9_9EIME|nr:histidine phosphatase clade-1 [Cyclospora cayetanensis]